jgi:uncharacterized membrane protein
MNRTYLETLQIGIVAGMRSMMAPAFISHKLAHDQPGGLANSKLHFLTSPTTATILKLLAGGELVGDKVPNAPDRIVPPQFIGRVLSGALSGAALSEIEGESVACGALIGGLGAVIGTVAFYHIRHWLTHEQGLPDPLVALAEDAIAIGTSWQLMKPDHSVHEEA